MIDTNNGIFMLYRNNADKNCNDERTNFTANTEFKQTKSFDLSKLNRRCK